ncbi:MAG: hypothetical protein PVH88_20400 [Ignavibacteria bacterium]|jgi:xylan 1,4-beta-xylosidase
MSVFSSERIFFSSSDSLSWVYKDDDGNIQVLLWDYTYPEIEDSVNNQEYFIRDLPAKDKGTVKVSLKEVPE